MAVATRPVMLAPPPLSELPFDLRTIMCAVDHLTKPRKSLPFQFTRNTFVVLVRALRPAFPP